MGGPPGETSRRELLRSGVRGACLVGAGLLGYRLVARGGPDELVWQIDPRRCTGCGLCAGHCVLKQSAARCHQAFELCGYCDLCSGFLAPRYLEVNSAAENQICPTGALRRRALEPPYFEYTVDRSLCIGCGKCVKACLAFGNGSLYLQLDQGACHHCNQCSIALVCPTDALVRVPRAAAYLLKGRPERG